MSLADPATDRSRTLNAWRRAGYRLLPGEGFSYVLHMRPGEWPIMAAHTTVGFLLATAFVPARHGTSWIALLPALLLWVVCLNGGTLALNSAFDDDEGDIGYLNAPPRPPRHLAPAAIALMALGQALAFTISLPFAAVYAVCFLLSLAYSVPPLRLKAVAGADWIINMVGFGTLTPMAGWFAAGRPLEPWAVLVLAAFCPLFAGLYPLTQLYQLEEDRSRGDRTLALVMGERRALWAALASVIIAFGMFAAAAMLRFRSASFVLVIALLAWLAVLIPWLRSYRGWTEREHKRGMYRALNAWAVTDIAVLVAFA